MISLQVNLNTAPPSGALCVRSSSTFGVRSLLPIIVLLFALASLVPASALSRCVRTVPDAQPGRSAPQLDGPGSFGALQDTVTLDCLTYVGSIQKDGIEHVLIKDERGTVHVMRVGDYMGEQTGIIKKIDADFILINQRVNRNGLVEDLIVKFPKNKKSTH